MSFAIAGLALSLYGSYQQNKAQQEAADAQNEHSALKRLAAGKAAKVQQAQLVSKQLEESKKLNQYKLETEKHSMREYARLQNNLSESGISGNSFDRLYTELSMKDQEKEDIINYNETLQDKQYFEEYRLIEVNKQNRIAGITDVKGPDTTASVVQALGAGLTTYASLGGFED